MTRVLLMVSLGLVLTVAVWAQDAPYTCCQAGWNCGGAACKPDGNGGSYQTVAFMTQTCQLSPNEEVSGYCDMNGAPEYCADKLTYPVLLCKGNWDSDTPVRSPSCENLAEPSCF